MKKPIALTCAAAVLCALALIGANIGADENPQKTPVPPPVLSVDLTQVEEVMLPLRVFATGNIVAWQEAIISAESDNLKLIAVDVNVGDSVKRGQVLARFNADILAAELAEASAAVAQAEAAAMEAALNFNRAKALEIAKTISAQQLDQTKVAATTANARVDAARAQEKKQRLRLAQAQVRAPSDGIITSRTATIGTVVPSAQELFRLIEDGRLEWRAVVATADMKHLAPAQTAVITEQNLNNLRGTLRMIAPTIDTGTHNGLVYVDLPPNTAVRAGTFTRGYIEVSDSLALTLPQRAVILRDGFHYAMQVDKNSVVVLKKISVGRKIDERIEIISGLKKSEAVIASGLGFLSEGDKVKVVNPLPTSPFARGRSEYPPHLVAETNQSPPLLKGRVGEGLTLGNIEEQQ
ncbi:MAG: efflux RND transporter periplasmic adaptor subunit [Cellvibrio sp.]|uniref:efflux RND transporter periplasmic adaptor subunit n=1 Tax=Cellvibrio sp. TaxID=1965322 RepID=UPI0031A5074B